MRVNEKVICHNGKSFAFYPLVKIVGINFFVRALGPRSLGLFAHALLIPSTGNWIVITYMAVGACERERMWLFWFRLFSI